jgi:hypothetical protein
MCITVCKALAAAYGYGVHPTYPVPQGRDNLAPAGLGECVAAILSVSCAALAYGYAYTVPAGLAVISYKFFIPKKEYI